MDNSWKPHIMPVLSSPKIKALSNFVMERRKVVKVYPDSTQVLRVFNMPLQDIRVVIIGQDPYPHNAADGLAFSSKESAVPACLESIFEGIEADFGFFVDHNPDLTYLEKQGVFLYNTLLTVEAGKPLSHLNKGWEVLAQKVIKTINEECLNVVFMLWGHSAKTYKAHIDPFKHCILEAPHPVAHKYNQNVTTKWENNSCFKKANEYLELYGKKPILWAGVF